MYIYIYIYIANAHAHTQTIRVGLIGSKCKVNTYLCVCCVCVPTRLVHTTSYTHTGALAPTRKRAPTHALTPEPTHSLKSGKEWECPCGEPRAEYGK